MSERDCRQEIDRIYRISDMLVTAHANLREKYARRALFLDMGVLTLSAWLTSVVFVEPRLGVKLTPFHFDPQVWIGIISVLTLVLSILQLRVDWKGLSDSHKRSFDLYAEVKNESRRLLSLNSDLTLDLCRGVLTMYELAGNVGAQIPEGEFLKQKRNHLRKVEISRYLDEHPGASLTILRLRLLLRGNLRETKG